MDFRYGEDHLTAGKTLAIVSGELKATISTSQKKRILNSANIIRQVAKNDRPVYGVNTGFGPLCTTKVTADKVEEIQEKLLISHAMGVGKPLENKIAKTILVLKVHSLAQGYSGVRLELIDRIIWMIENNIIPVIPSQGSVGASGDLAPLSHCFLPLIGLGDVIFSNKKQKSVDVLKSFSLQPLRLEPKEGLALINGTQFIAAHAIHILDRFCNCLSGADISGAMMIEALKGSASPFHPGIHRIRPFHGNMHVAHRLFNLIADSEINSSHKECLRVQDPYSLRCIPQVHGSSRDAWKHLKERIEVEINAVTDNPLIVNENEIISGGNFHGQPLAMTLDYVGLAAAELGSITERRIYLLLKGQDDELPKLLLKNIGINSGFMIMQYTAAALASENKTLCFPASADSIPTSLGQEDHVSMGSISGRKTLSIIENLERIISIEFIVAAQALDFRKPLKPHPILQEVHDKIRSSIPFATEDRLFYNDIESMVKIFTSKSITELVKHKIDSEYKMIKSPYDEVYEFY